MGVGARDERARSRAGRANGGERTAVRDGAYLVFVGHGGGRAIVLRELRRAAAQWRGVGRRFEGSRQTLYFRAFDLRCSFRERHKHLVGK